MSAPNLHLPSSGNGVLDVVLYVVVTVLGGGKLFQAWQDRLGKKQALADQAAAAETKRRENEWALDIAREQREIDASKERDKWLYDSMQWQKAQVEAMLARISAAEERARESDQRARSLQTENADCQRKFDELKMQNEQQADEIAELKRRIATLEEVRRLDKGKI